MPNPFFNNCGPLNYLDILKILNTKGDDQTKNQEIIDIKDLFTAENNDISFFHSKIYLIYYIFFHILQKY